MVCRYCIRISVLTYDRYRQEGQSVQFTPISAGSAPVAGDGTERVAQKKTFAQVVDENLGNHDKVFYQSNHKGYDD